MQKDKNNAEKQELPDFHVIIAAAGSGTRFGADTPKQYLPLCGKPVIRHSIETFLSFKSCKSVSVVINPEDLEIYENSVDGLSITQHIYGGKERSISINNALEKITNVKNEDIILVHDAARPCVQPEDIANLLLTMKEEHAASLASPVASTLRRDNQQYAQDAVSREQLWAMQTPQAFRYGDLLKAHTQADKSNQYTDDTTLVSELGIDVKLVESSEENIKITTQKDFKMAEKILSAQYETRTGMGFDVHAFDKDSNGPIRLCGIDVDYDYKLKGHSDADVGLHALTDAILGAIGEGDIGVHFPPSNDDFKDMDSEVFLKHAVELLKKRGGHITNLDLTIICEEPKIGPHAPQMKQRIASICNITEDKINVKATTTERLGFTGRKEGIAAQAVASVKVPV